MDPESGVARAQEDEEGKIADTVIGIRNQLSTPDPEGYAIKLANASFLLPTVEAEAFRSPFAGENSFRGHLTAAFIDLAAVYARMLAAFEEYKQVRTSTYLWQPKAESLKFLVPRANKALEQTHGVFTTAKERGLTEKVSAMVASRDRLRGLTAEVTKALQEHKA